MPKRWTWKGFQLHRRHDSWAWNLLRQLRRRSFVRHLNLFQVGNGLPDLELNSLEGLCFAIKPDCCLLMPIICFPTVPDFCQDLFTLDFSWVSGLILSLIKTILPLSATSWPWALHIMLRSLCEVVVCCKIIFFWVKISCRFCWSIQQWISDNFHWMFVDMKKKIDLGYWSVLQDRHYPDAWRFLTQNSDSLHVMIDDMKNERICRRMAWLERHTVIQTMSASLMLHNPYARKKSTAYCNK